MLVLRGIVSSVGNKPGNKIKAIKAVFDYAGLGLRDAKDAVDNGVVPAIENADRLAEFVGAMARIGIAVEKDGAPLAPVANIHVAKQKVGELVATLLREYPSLGSPVTDKIAELQNYLEFGI